MFWAQGLSCTLRPSHQTRLALAEPQDPAVTRGDTTSNIRSPAGKECSYTFTTVLALAAKLQLVTQGRGRAAATPTEQLHRREKWVLQIPAPSEWGCQSPLLLCKETSMTVATWGCSLRIVFYPYKQADSGTFPF